jgi:hypothetical protein
VPVVPLPPLRHDHRSSIYATLLFSSAENLIAPREIDGINRKVSKRFLSGRPMGTQVIRLIIPPFDHILEMGLKVLKRAESESFYCRPILVDFESPLNSAQYHPVVAVRGALAILVLPFDSENLELPCDRVYGVPRRVVVND